MVGEESNLDVIEAESTIRRERKESERHSMSTRGDKDGCRLLWHTLLKITFPHKLTLCEPCYLTFASVGHVCC